MFCFLYKTEENEVNLLYFMQHKYFSHINYDKTESDRLFNCCLNEMCLKI